MPKLVTLFESTDAGAPTLNNAVGSLIAVLDACLITGYNTKSVTSITVSAGVATVVCTGHGFPNTYGKVIRHAGAMPAGLNIDARISGVTTNGYTFLCPGVADGVATGTITAKIAPMDWTKQYSGTNTAMYKRSDAAANGCMLRIADNAVGQSARALMVQTATGIDTYTNPSPVAGQIADGLGQYWSKGYNSAVAADWYIVADGLMFYLFVKCFAGTNTPHLPHCFGDIPSFRPADTLNCVMGGWYVAGLTTNGPLAAGNTQPGAFVISGGKNGITTSQVLYVDLATTYGVTTGPQYPSDVDGGLVIVYPVLLSEAAVPTATNGHRRGVMPGLAGPLARTDTVLVPKTQVSLTGGRIFIMANSASAVGNNSAQCVPMIDLTGPWR